MAASETEEEHMAQIEVVLGTSKGWKYRIRTGDVRIGRAAGNNVKVQNNVSIYTGAVIEDDVFLGPSCVLTNVSNPRSQINRHSLYEKTVIRRGATIGANATIVCGVTLGKYSFVGAGAVVSRDVPNYALVIGVPARQIGWVCSCGIRLRMVGTTAECSACGRSYSIQNGECSEIATPTVVVAPPVHEKIAA